MHSRPTARIFKLNSSSDWEEHGTGLVSCDFLPDSKVGVLSVAAQTQPHNLLLMSRISPEAEYTTLDRAAIVWKEPESQEEIALSFNSPSQRDLICSSMLRLQHHRSARPTSLWIDEVERQQLESAAISYSSHSLTDDSSETPQEYPQENPHDNPPLDDDLCSRGRSTPAINGSCSLEGPPADLSSPSSDLLEPDRVAPPWLPAILAVSCASNRSSILYHQSPFALAHPLPAGHLFSAEELDQFLEQLRSIAQLQKDVYNRHLSDILSDDFLDALFATFQHTTTLSSSVSSSSSSSSSLTEISHDLSIPQCRSSPRSYSCSSTRRDGCEDTPANAEYSKNLVDLCRAIVIDLLSVACPLLYETILTQSHVEHLYAILAGDGSQAATDDRSSEFSEFDALILQEPHLPKLQFARNLKRIKDLFLVPNSIEETLLNNVNIVLQLINREIVQDCFSRPDWIEIIGRRIKHETVQSEGNLPFFIFLRQFVGFFTFMQPSEHLTFFINLISVGMVSLLTTHIDCRNPQVRSIVCDILDILVRVHPSSIQTKIMSQIATGKQSLLAKLIYRVQWDALDHLKMLSMEILKILLSVVDCALPPTVAGQSEGPSSTDFLNIFSDTFLKVLCRPILASAIEGGTSLSASEQVSWDLIAELLRYLLQSSACQAQMVAFLLKHKMIPRLLRVLTFTPRPTYLSLTVLRFFGAVLRLMNETMIKKIVKHQMFDVIVATLVQNGERSNLLNSVLLSIFDALNVRSQSRLASSPSHQGNTDVYRPLILHLVERHRTVFERIRYVTLFQDLIFRASQTDVGNDLSSTPELVDQFTPTMVSDPDDFFVAKPQPSPSRELFHIPFPLVEPAPLENEPCSSDRQNTPLHQIPLLDHGLAAVPQSHPIEGVGRNTSVFASGHRFPHLHEMLPQPRDDDEPGYLPPVSSFDTSLKHPPQEPSSPEDILLLSFSQQESGSNSPTPDASPTKRHAPTDLDDCELIKRHKGWFS